MTHIHRNRNTLTVLGRAVTVMTALAILWIVTGNLPATALGSPTALTILFHSDPQPLRVRDNKFEVMVKDADKAVKDADVSLVLVMPKNGKMPEMKNTVLLKHYGDGMYRGAGQVTAAGDWSVTIVVSREGKEIGTRPLTLTAKNDTGRGSSIGRTSAPSAPPSNGNPPDRREAAGLYR